MPKADDSGCVSPLRSGRPPTICSSRIFICSQRRGERERESNYYTEYYYCYNDDDVVLLLLLLYNTLHTLLTNANTGGA